MSDNVYRVLGSLTNAAGCVIGTEGHVSFADAMAQLRREWTRADAFLCASPYPSPPICERCNGSTMVINDAGEPDDCNCNNGRAPSPSPSSAPRPDMEQAARYLDNLGYGMAAHVLRAAPASPQGDRERADEIANALRFLDHAGRELMGYESPSAIPTERWETFRLGLVQSNSVIRRYALAASSPHYAEK